MRILSIDNSVISYIAWYRMHSANWVNKTGCEIVEYTRNYVELMQYVVNLCNPDKTFILLDCENKNWRHQVQLDYYLEHTKVFQHKNLNNVQLIFFDEKYYTLTWDGGQERWIRSKALTKKEQADLDMDLYDKAYLDEHHFEFLPQYKGNRSKVWNFGTKREEYKDKSMVLARKAAPLFNAVCVQENDFEADCLAFMVVSLFPDDEHIMATTDTDWQQLSLIGDVKYYDPKEHCVHDKTEDQYRWSFYSKLIGGDTSDNVPGAFLLNDKGVPKKYAEKSAQNLVDSIGLSNIIQYMKERSTPSMERNKLLISMKRGYAHNKKVRTQGTVGAINQIVHGSVIPHSSLTYRDFDTTETAMHIQAQTAHRDRKKVGL